MAGQGVSGPCLRSGPCIRGLRVGLACPAPEQVHECVCSGMQAQALRDRLLRPRKGGQARTRMGPCGATGLSACFCMCGEGGVAWGRRLHGGNRWRMGGRRRRTDSDGALKRSFKRAWGTCGHDTNISMHKVVKHEPPGSALHASVVTCKLNARTRLSSWPGPEVVATRKSNTACKGVACVCQGAASASRCWHGSRADTHKGSSSA